MKKSALQAYHRFVGDITALLESARRQSARSINAILTATYWEIGRRVIEYEQAGGERAVYGEDLLERLSGDLSRRFGRGFSRSNLQQMRRLYLTHLPAEICQTVSGKFGAPALPPSPTPAPAKNPSLEELVEAFPLSWSHYVRLLQVQTPGARVFYETEALRGGWSVRQLDRQISSQFYERTALSRNKALMLRKGAKARPEDQLTPEEEIKEPFILEFLGLKDEYSETDLEEALIRRLETFLLELGGDFTFVARQKRLRIGGEWFRVDLVFFHRALHCLVLIDIKLSKFRHTDAGQMHMYLNFARKHWSRPDESPPVGLILCAQKDAAVARYALDGLPNKVMAAEYRTALPDEALIAHELDRARRRLDARRPPRPRSRPAPRAAARSLPKPAPPLASDREGNRRHSGRRRR